MCSLRSDRSGGYLKQTLVEFKTDELWKFGLGFFSLEIIKVIMRVIMSKSCSDLCYHHLQVRYLHVAAKDRSIPG